MNLKMLLANCHPYCSSLNDSLRPSDAIWWHRPGSTLAQAMACCLMAPSHYLNQSWLIVSKAQWHSSKGNFRKKIPQPPISELVWKTYLSKITFQSPRGQWVKYEGVPGSSYLVIIFMKCGPPLVDSKLQIYWLAWWYILSTYTVLSMKYVCSIILLCSILIILWFKVDFTDPFNSLAPWTCCCNLIILNQ